MTILIIVDNIGEYYEKKIRYHNELDRNSVEIIEDVLNTLYLRDAFFELETLSLQHQMSSEKSKLPDISFMIDGEKRLIKE